MAHRLNSDLNSGGALLDRSQPVSFWFNGEALQGYEGDTLALSLIHI